ncbi:hypothetical protein DFQ10_101244 [Winogradskyella eximia]|uniref:Uncharacterized protein n=1 Tax=Winogradskyella eximia TaxID=262006 RepID=A0A3D9HAG3_9FLAO|nr:hypothetical protein [Winogradskyella eximia]RED46474.1 hypothetical protein DFQ10_101244 [Winogradskyella eximia]
MRNKLSSITICLLLLVINYSCEKEERIELETNQSRSIILEDISVGDVKHPYKVSGLLSNFSTTISNGLQRKSSEATQDDFIIDTTSVKYIEGPVSHSYTFTVKSTDINPNVVQNLVLAKHNDMDSYLSLIYTYNLTDSELLLIEQGEYPIEYVNEPIVESVEGFAGLLGRGPCVFYETVGFQVH